MNRLNTRIRKLEGTSNDLTPIRTVLYQIFDKGKKGPEQVGAIAQFPGFPHFELRAQQGEEYSAFDDRASLAADELQALKKLPDGDVADAVKTKIAELLEQEKIIQSGDRIEVI